MPLRSVKMNRFIFGFHRRVWCPKWTPLSSSCFMVTTAIAGINLFSVVRAPRWFAADALLGFVARVRVPARPGARGGVRTLRSEEPQGPPDIVRLAGEFAGYRARAREVSPLTRTAEKILPPATSPSPTGGRGRTELSTTGPVVHRSGFGSPRASRVPQAGAMESTKGFRHRVTGRGLVVIALVTAGFVVLFGGAASA